MDHGRYVVVRWNRFQVPGFSYWKQRPLGCQQVFAAGRVHKASSNDIKLPWTGPYALRQKSGNGSECQAIASPADQAGWHTDYVIDRNGCNRSERCLIERLDGVARGAGLSSCLSEDEDPVQR